MHTATERRDYKAVGRASLSRCSRGALSPRRSPQRLYAAVVSICGAVLAASVSAEPPIPWLVREAKSRVVYKVPDSEASSVLVEIPRLDPASRSAKVRAFDAESRPMWTHVAYAGGDKISAVVSAVSSDRYKEFTAYAIEGAENSPAPAAGIEPEHLPVSLEVRHLGGQAVPTSWERMRFMASSADPERWTSYLPSFDAASRGLEEGERIVVLRSFVLCSEDGVYRFALSCQDAGFLLLDGSVVVEWPGEHEAARWREGAPVVLKAGTHRIEMYNCGIRRRYVFRAGWRPPGAAAVAPIPREALLAGCRAADVRLEQVDKTLHPGFVWEEGRAYSFGGKSPVFIPITFRSTSVNWLTSVMRREWDFGDGKAGDENAVTHVYSRAGRYAVSLNLSDSLGFARAHSETVECRGMDPAPYTLRCGVTGLPAVGYPADAMEPRLKVYGQTPAGRFDVDCQIESRSGPRENRHFDLNGPALSLDVPLASRSADSLRCIRWRIRHFGADVTAGTVSFLSPPFDRSPAEVRGSDLYAADGTQLVLVPSCYAAERAAAPRQRTASRWVCLDDFLGAWGSPDDGSTQRFDRVAAQLAGAESEIRIRYAPLPEWARAPQAYGPLLKIANAATAVNREDEGVILCVGLRDILGAVPPEAFERQIAALTDLLTSTLGKAVIWVTPPPYPPEADVVRPYAGAVRRVAEARGIPVADLYTAFLCNEDRQHPLFCAGRLAPTARGQLLAGKIIANALLLERGENQQCRSARWNLVFGSLR